MGVKLGRIHMKPQHLDRMGGRRVDALRDRTGKRKGCNLFPHINHIVLLFYIFIATESAEEVIRKKQTSDNTRRNSGVSSKRARTRE